MSNVEEYATDSDPTVPDGGMMGLLASVDGGQLNLKSYRRANLLDVGMRFLESTGLATWTETDGTTETKSTPVLGLEQVTVSIEVDDAQLAFVRLETY